MKKIDILLAKSFVGPFLVTFLIALFVLIMQTLWVYIDEIIGKGVGILMITELIAYMSISLFILAIPIAVLISSVMVMGNLAERYELASLKSAGVPLLRIVAPLAAIAFGLSVFSFFCSNNLIPISNLQFKSRLYDIRKSKPTLNLEAGVFNDDFQGFTIYLKEKSENGRDVKEVLIYDQSAIDGKINQISAQRGEMYTTADDRFFVMNLYDGTQSQEVDKKTERGQRGYAFVRTNFKEYKKVFDLTEFSIQETKKDLFKNHQTMLNVRQLAAASDSIEAKITRKEGKLEKHFIQFLYFERQQDTLYFNNKKPSLDKKTEAVTKPKAKKVRFKNRKLKNQIPDLDWSSISSFVESFEEKDRAKILKKAKSTARSIKSQTTGTLNSLKRERELRVKHIYEMHIKFSMAAVCFIFLFIGAPMGAMIQKGGFGYPILISVLFFTLFIMLTIACEKLAESFAISAELGAWLPCIILAPLAAFLTYKAMQDAKIVNINRIVNWFKNILRYIGIGTD